MSIRSTVNFPGEKLEHTMKKQSQFNQANLKRTLKAYPSTTMTEALKAFRDTVARGSSHKAATELALQVAYKDDAATLKRARRAAGLSVSGYIVNTEKRWKLWREDRKTKKNDTRESAVGVYVWRIIVGIILGGFVSLLIAWAILTIVGLTGVSVPLIIPMLGMLFGMLIGAVIGWIRATLVLEHRSEEHEKQEQEKAIKKAKKVKKESTIKPEQDAVANNDATVPLPISHRAA